MCQRKKTVDCTLFDKFRQWTVPNGVLSARGPRLFCFFVGIRNDNTKNVRNSPRCASFFSLSRQKPRLPAAAALEYRKGHCFAGSLARRQQCCVGTVVAFSLAGTFSFLRHHPSSVIVPAVCLPHSRKEREERKTSGLSFFRPRSFRHSHSQHSAAEEHKTSRGKQHGQVAAEDPSVVLLLATPLVVVPALVFVYLCCYRTHAQRSAAQRRFIRLATKRTNKNE